MTTPNRYSDADRKRLGVNLRSGGPLKCPDCGTALDRRRFPPRDDVSYVRDRVWIACPTCHRSAVLDSKQPE